MRLILFALICCFATAIQSAPLHYKIDLKAENDAFGGPLSGADLQLNITWDAVALQPSSSSAIRTYWPTSNSTGSLIVSGSTSVDGVYSGTFSTYAWHLDQQ